MLIKSLQFTIEHPIFGVGPGDFSSFEGGTRAETKHGEWQQTHNSYTQVSSEIGIPAAICYIGAIFAALFSLNRSMVRARRDKIPVLVTTAFCCMLSIVMIAACMFFLSLAYRFYMPGLTALAIALDRVMRMEFQKAQPAPAGAGPVGAGSVARTPARRVPQSRFVRESYPG